MNARLERWLATIVGLSDLPLKVGYARSELQQGDASDLATAFDELCRAVDYGHHAARDVLGAFVPHLVDPEQLERIASVRALAKERQLPAASRLLRASTPRGHLLDRDEPARPEAKLLTLGERRALARKPSRALLAKLMSDPHPLVVRILLANPRLTEDDVIGMAAKRPALAQVIVEIAKSWSRRARVRMAMVLNPGSPPAVSVPLLALLGRSELVEVVRAVDLLPIVRTTAQELWELRPPLRSVPLPEQSH